jgi:hypothetical protein
MEVTDVLILCAEVSVSLAGFAGIVATFQFRDGKKVNPIELAGLTIIVNVALLDTFSAIVPLVLFSYGLKETTVWGLSSGIIAILAAMLLYKVSRDISGKIRRKSLVVYYGFLQVMMGMAVILVALNSMGIVFHRTPGPFITCVVAGMSLCGLMFARMLIHPLSRRLREQGASSAAV